MARDQPTRREEPVTEVQRELRRRGRRRLPLHMLAVLVVVVGVVTVIAALWATRAFTREHTTYIADVEEHFKYGSIGSETASGLPYWVWKALPELFPERFQGRGWEAFGFLYEEDARGRRRDLPIGVSKRRVGPVDLVWLNCAVCHAGTTRESEDGPRTVHLAMPSNNLDLYGFIDFLLEIAPDPRLRADSLLPAMQRAGANLGPIDRLIWRRVVVPELREGLLERRARLQPLLEVQPAWGPGRVDTFNPYKLIQFDVPFHELSEAERVGTTDFPSVFLQRPRIAMDLHWDGNNPSLEERNLSAAIGAGVTPKTVDHHAIGRIATWLLDLEPPPSPYTPDPAAVEEGRAIYMAECAACHGYQGGDRYVFEGQYLGKVEPIARLGVDPARLDSYTEDLRERQLTLFAGTRYRFRHFQKTDGYANAPLDGLWLRAPYLHNGAVPTLADLLEPPEARPAAFVRGLDVLDPERGGFVAPPCTPGEPLEAGFCFDTSLPGNGNSGHLYGVILTPEEKRALLAYLKTF